MRLPRLLTGTAIVAVLSGTAACGLQSVEPKLELRDAANAFTTSGPARCGSRSAARWPTSAPSATRPTRRAPPAPSQGITAHTIPSDADLRKLVSSRLEFAFDSGADKKSPTDDSAQVLVHIGDTDAGEIRTVDQTIYGRVNMPGLVTEFPDMKSGVDSFRASLSSGPEAGGPPAAIAGPATAVLDGRWVSLDMHAGSWLDGQLKSASGAGLAGDYQAKIKALAGKAFGGGAVAVKRLDSDDKLGDHLVATTNLRKVYANIRGDVAGLFTGSTGAEIAKQLPPVTDAPDRNFDVSFWVKDGALTRVELDAAQFLDKPAGHLVLRLDALPKQKITAPSGAVVIDAKAIVGQTGLPLSQLLSGNGAPVGGVVASGRVWPVPSLRSTRTRSPRTSTRTSATWPTGTASRRRCPTSPGPVPTCSTWTTASR